MQKAKAEGSSQIISALTQLYDQPLELEPPLRSRRIVAEAPTLGIIASSTPDWFVKNLRDIDIMGGFANRWTYWTGNPKPPMPWPDKPKQKALRAIAESVTRAYERWEPGTEFGLAAEAKAAWESFYESWTNQARKDGDLPTSKMESRIPEHTVKLALCHAALENTEATISGDQMAAAIEVADYLRESVRYAFSDRLTASEHPLVKLESRILSLLAERGPMKKRDLSRFAKQRNTTASDFNRVLEGLIKAGAVTFDTETRLVGLADD